MSVAQSILYLDNVSVSFDGFRALNALSLTLEPGELRAIIGPNGAGKTTMMDIITGKTRLMAGMCCLMAARSISLASTRRRLPPWALAANSRSRPCSRL